MISDRLSLATYDAFAPLHDEWEQLAADVEAAPFLRAGWAASWWEAFGDGRLEIRAARRAGRLVAIAPMRRYRGALRSTTNAHTPEFGLLAADRTAAEGLAAGLFSGARRVVVELIASTEQFDRLQSAAWAEDYSCVARAPLRSPILDIRGSWEEYERTVDRRMISDLRRRRRRLADLGPIALDVVDGRARLTELLVEGFALEESGWKAERGTAIRAQRKTQLFYTLVARWAADRGWLRLAFLRVGERGIAFQYGLEHADTYYFLKGGYDVAYARFAPGRLLLQDMIQRAYVQKLRRFELLGADEPWKLEWTRAVRERLTLDAFAPSPIGTLERVLHRSGRPVARRLRNMLASTRPRR